jgi:3-hexulose-6-phosphate synthase
MGVMNASTEIEGAEDQHVELQVALDRLPLDTAVALARDLAEACEWLEVGTSLVKQYGMEAVDAIATAASGTRILADLKTIDDAAYEFAMAYAAGASSATVVGLAGDPTIDRAIATARDAGRECMIDLMGLDARRRAELAERIDDDAVIFAAHVAKDAQAGGVGINADFSTSASGRRIAVAGGLDIDSIRAMPRYPRMRIIVGSAVTAAPNPLAAARAIHDVCRIGAS